MTVEPQGDPMEAIQLALLTPAKGHALYSQGVRSPAIKELHARYSHLVRETKKSVGDVEGKVGTTGENELRAVLDQVETVLAALQQHEVEALLDLRCLARARRLLNDIVSDYAGRSRDEGATWAEIGDALEISPSGARQQLARRRTA